jgi:transcriptional regulator with XRE-family HTH domain
MKVPGLRALREERGMSQRDLGLKSSVTKATIIGIEAGRDAYPITIYKLAEALGVTPADLTAARIS